MNYSDVSSAKLLTLQKRKNITPDFSGQAWLDSTNKFVNYPKNFTKILLVNSRKRATLNLFTKFCFPKIAFMEKSFRWLLWINLKTQR